MATDRTRVNFSKKDPVIVRSKKIIIVPILVLLLIILIDKVVLIPAVRDCCSDPGYGFVFREVLENEIYEESRIHADIRVGKKIALVLGSSMSYGFNYLNLKSPEKRPHSPHTGQWRMLVLAYPGATMLTHYVRLNQVLDRGIRPDLIIVEFAPSVFNSATPIYNHELFNTVPLSMAFRKFSDLPGGIRNAVFLSRIFTTLRYRPAFRRSNIKPENFLMNVQMNMMHGARSGSGGEMLREPLVLPQTLYPLYYGTIEKATVNYRPNPDLEFLLHEMLRKVHEKKIRLVLYYPPLFSEAYRLIQARTEKRGWSALVNHLPPGPFAYRNMNEESFSCDVYIDPFHIHPHCFGRLFAEIIRSSGRKRDSQNKR